MALDELSEIVAAPTDVEKEYELRALGECINCFLHTRVSKRDYLLFTDGTVKQISGPELQEYIGKDPAIE